MAQQLFVLAEILAMLEAVGAKRDLMAKFQNQAEYVTAYKNEKTLDDITVSSGFGMQTQQGTVELSLNDQRTQMDSKKAKSIGLMLIEAAEAAESDQIFVQLLKRLGIEEPLVLARILADLRELRQGTRGVSQPS